MFRRVDAAVEDKLGGFDMAEAVEAQMGCLRDEKDEVASVVVGLVAVDVVDNGAGRKFEAADYLDCHFEAGVVARYAVILRAETLNRFIIAWL